MVAHRFSELEMDDLDLSYAIHIVLMLSQNCLVKLFWQINLPNICMVFVRFWLNSESLSNIKIAISA